MFPDLAVMMRFMNDDQLQGFIANNPILAEIKDDPRIAALRFAALRGEMGSFRKGCKWVHFIRVGPRKWLCSVFLPEGFQPIEETRHNFRDAPIAHFAAMREVGEQVPEPRTSVDYVEVAA